jgi:prevent-host-death family protein
MERIGVSELRQHASHSLDRVGAGEAIEVTHRGRPVARLVPVVEPTWDDLIESGVVIPPAESMVDLLAEMRPHPLRPGAPLPSESVSEGREERL